MELHHPVEMIASSWSAPSHEYYLERRMTRSPGLRMTTARVRRRMTGRMEMTEDIGQEPRPLVEMKNG